MRMNYKPIIMDNNQQNIKQTDLNFNILFQRALLLGLKEAGHLNEMQHRQAEATLLEQHRENIRAHAESLKDD